MNKKLIFFLLGLFAALIAVNFYFVNRDSTDPEIIPAGATKTTKSATNRAETPTGASTRPAVSRHQDMTTPRKKDPKHDTSWQKPDYQPTEEEQAREAILATMSPEEQRQARADLYKMSMYYRSVEEVDKAIEEAKKVGNRQALERLERFRMLAWPND